ncbi:hypothetical protein EYF80_029414 [Liparis tanakae]|uniref:Uncharacterized protein n=1 Tax=Liparis tanakae TaxID=230148 RepID=A0A4Z2H572_9TELE|nr:hypothetical protein EYF80_029414 [Liparis tanakae]
MVEGWPLEAEGRQQSPNVPVPGPVVLPRLLPRPVDRRLSAARGAVSRRRPAQGGRVAPGWRRRASSAPWGLVGGPEDPIQGLGLGRSTEVVPGGVGGVGGAGGQGGGVVGAGGVEEVRRVGVELQGVLLVVPRDEQWGLRMLRGGGLSPRWYISTTGLGTEVLDTTCWSWMVLLLKAFLMLMSCRETGGRRTENIERRTCQRRTKDDNSRERES